MSRNQSSSRRRTRGSTSASNTQSTSNTTSTKSTGPYNRNFQQNLIDGGVYPPAYGYPDGQAPAKPDNWEEIRQRLTLPRPFLSPIEIPGRCRCSQREASNNLGDSIHRRKYQ